MPLSAREVDGRAHFVATGRLEPEEIVQAIKSFHRRHRVKHAIWDLSAASLSGISPESFRHILEAADAFSAQRGPGAKTAVFVKDLPDAMVVKAFAGVAETETPIVFRAFYDYGTLLAWLKD